MKILKLIWKIICEIGKSDCPKCKGKKCLSFYYEQAFTQENIYMCSECKEDYIIL